MSEYKPNQDNNVFNMGYATLYRIDEIMKQVKSISLMIANDKHYSLPDLKTHFEIKIALIKDLYWNCRPLIKDKTKKDELEKEVKKFIVPKRKTKNPTLNGLVTKTESYYDSELDDSTYDFIIKLSDALQDAGTFMPHGNDPRFAMKRD